MQIYSALKFYMDLYIFFYFTIKECFCTYVVDKNPSVTPRKCNIFSINKQ